MGGGRRKFRHCRLGSSFDDAEHMLGLAQGVSSSERNIFKVRGGNFAEQQLELCVARTQFTKRVIEETEQKETLPVEETDSGHFFVRDPLLPRCRHNPLHAVPLRNLRKHEVSSTAYEVL
ncbi:hypothetical protein FGB62_142g076 [Gracilaria domingensis]|nr:hypothetical protein FGB62_142g076 [Gracilaria domingensis]